jgi:hypothetical protein
MSMSTTRWWVLTVCFSSAFLYLDYLTGTQLQFPIAFTIPILVATWFLGVAPGLGFAVLLTGLRFWMALTQQEPPNLFIISANAGIRLAVFVLLVGLTHRLQSQRDRVRILEGILPICSFCKDIRTEDGTWVRLESYISANSTAQLSHSLCETCRRKHYPEYPE